jgi:hypothetical protein
MDVLLISFGYCLCYHVLLKTLKGIKCIWLCPELVVLKLVNSRDNKELLLSTHLLWKIEKLNKQLMHGRQINLVRNSGTGHLHIICYH